MGLEHLFDVELRFEPGAPPIASPTERQGAFVGSGDGTVAGPDIRGTIRWSNFETPGPRTCAMYPVGVIETTDGGSIVFDGKGFALLQENMSRWQVAGALRVESASGGPSWLRDALLAWEGTFDPDSGRGVWRVYRPTAG